MLTCLRYKVVSQPCHIMLVICNFCLAADKQHQADGGYDSTHDIENPEVGEGQALSFWRTV